MGVADFEKLSHEILADLRNVYARMSLDQLKAAVEARCLSQYRVEHQGTSSFMRRPATCSAPGPAAKQLRKQLHESDARFQELCPDAGFSLLSQAELRSLVSGVGISRGDGTMDAMLSNLR